MRRFSQDEVAAEEQRIGARLPEDLRGRFLSGVPDEVVLQVDEQVVGAFAVWGPSTSDTDTKGRAYPTSGMARETQEVRDVDEGFLSDEVVVAWGHDGGGDLAVVLQDGSLGWWALSGGPWPARMSTGSRRATFSPSSEQPAATNRARQRAKWSICLEVAPGNSYSGSRHSAQYWSEATWPTSPSP